MSEWDRSRAWYKFHDGGVCLLDEVRHCYHRHRNVVLDRAAFQLCAADISSRSFQNALRWLQLAAIAA